MGDGRFVSMEINLIDIVTHDPRMERDYDRR